MGESYDSLGSRVVRSFRHYIDGTRHVWLKGNYRDPSMDVKEAFSDMKALPPITSDTSDASSNSFLPISSAPLTDTKSSECLMKPKPLPAKAIKNDNDVLEEIQKEENSDSNICNLVTEKTLEIVERPLENVNDNTS